MNSVEIQFAFKMPFIDFFDHTHHLCNINKIWSWPLQSPSLVRETEAYLSTVTGKTERCCNPGTHKCYGITEDKHIHFAWGGIGRLDRNGDTWANSKSISRVWQTMQRGEGQTRKRSDISSDREHMAQSWRIPVIGSWSKCDSREKGEEKVENVSWTLILTDNKFEFYSGDNGEYY